VALVEHARDWHFGPTFSKLSKVPGAARVDLPMILVPHPHVRVDANVLGGSPYVVGSRVPVRRLWAFYRKGVTLDTLLRRFPRLGPAKILDALAFAYDNEEVILADIQREEQLLDRVESSEKAAKNPPAKQMRLPFSE
jgi:uncharacterized protein (DUF433 family)